MSAITIREAQGILGKSQPAISRYISSGKLEATKDKSSGKVAINLASVEALAEKQKAKRDRAKRVRIGDYYEIAMQEIRRLQAENERIKKENRVLKHRSAWLIKWLGEEWDKERDGEIDEVDPDDCFLQIEDKQCLTMMDRS